MEAYILTAHLQQKDGNIVESGTFDEAALSTPVLRFQVNDSSSADVLLCVELSAIRHKNSTSIKMYF